MKALAYLGAFVVVIPLLLLNQGWAVSTLWGWFVAPLGAPAIGIPAAIGIVLTVSIARYKGPKGEKRAQGSIGDAAGNIVSTFIIPPLVVCVGWIVKQFL